MTIVPSTSLVFCSNDNAIHTLFLFIYLFIFFFFREPQVRKHLKNVYATFTLATIAAAAGGYAHMFSSLIGAGLMTGLGAIGTLIWLMMTPYDGKNQVQRLSLFGSFAFLTGCNLGPLLDMAVRVNPALVSGLSGFEGLEGFFCWWKIIICSIVLFI